MHTPTHQCLYIVAVPCKNALTIYYTTALYKFILRTTSTHLWICGRHEHLHLWAPLHLYLLGFPFVWVAPFSWEPKDVDWWQIKWTQIMYLESKDERKVRASKWCADLLFAKAGGSSVLHDFLVPSPSKYQDMVKQIHLNTKWLDLLPMSNNHLINQHSNGTWYSIGNTLWTLVNSAPALQLRHLLMEACLRRWCHSMGRGLSQPYIARFMLNLAVYINIFAQCLASLSYHSCWVLVLNVNKATKFSH